MVLRKNNIAQRNLSVIDVLAKAPGARAISSPFVAGSLATKNVRCSLKLIAQNNPQNQKFYLSLDDDGVAFPFIDFTGHYQTE